MRNFKKLIKKDKLLLIKFIKPLFWGFLSLIFIAMSIIGLKGFEKFNWISIKIIDIASITVWSAVFVIVGGVISLFVWYSKKFKL